MPVRYWSMIPPNAIPQTPWNRLREMEAPIRPDVRHEADTQYFENYDFYVTSSSCLYYLFGSIFVFQSSVMTHELDLCIWTWPWILSACLDRRMVKTLRKMLEGFRIRFSHTNTDTTNKDICTGWCTSIFQQNFTSSFAVLLLVLLQVLWVVLRVLFWHCPRHIWKRRKYAVVRHAPW